MDVETITHVFPDCAKEKEIHSIGDIPPRLETAQLNRDGKRWEDHNILWRKPDPGVIKINVERGFSEITGQGAVGFIARDWNGEVLAGGAKMVHDPCSPNLAKAEAFMAGVALAVGKRCTRVVFEGDAIEIVNRLGNPILDLSTLGTQLEPIREATKDFISRSFTNVNRISNRVAHELVQWALGNSCDTSFNYDYPNFI
ncbi:hypothetical protein V6N13_123957 [Hibiscus sabdariffa]